MKVGLWLVQKKNTGWEPIFKGTDFNFSSPFYGHKDVFTLAEESAVQGQRILGPPKNFTMNPGPLVAVAPEERSSSNVQNQHHAGYDAAAWAWKEANFGEFCEFVSVISLLSLHFSRKICCFSCSLSDNMDDIHFVWNWTEFAAEPLRNWHCMGITGNWAGILGNDAIKQRDSRIASPEKTAWNPTKVVLWHSKSTWTTLGPAKTNTTAGDKSLRFDGSVTNQHWYFSIGNSWIPPCDTVAFHWIKAYQIA